MITVNILFSFIVLLFALQVRHEFGLRLLTVTIILARSGIIQRKVKVS